MIIALPTDFVLVAPFGLLLVGDPAGLVVVNQWGIDRL